MLPDVKKGGFASNSGPQLHSEESLPAVIGDAKPVAVKLDADALRVKVREIAQGMTAKNWRKSRAALLALAR